MNEAIDIWGCCPKCKDNWDKKGYTNISKVFVPDFALDKMVFSCYKCPKCGMVFTHAVSSKPDKENVHE